MAAIGFTYSGPSCLHFDFSLELAETVITSPLLSERGIWRSRKQNCSQVADVRHLPKEEPDSYARRTGGAGGEGREGWGISVFKNQVGSCTIVM